MTTYLNVRKQIDKVKLELEAEEDVPVAKRVSHRAEVGASVERVYQEIDRMEASGIDPAKAEQAATRMLTGLSLQLAQNREFGLAARQSLQEQYGLRDLIQTTTFNPGTSRQKPSSRTEAFAEKRQRYIQCLRKETDDPHNVTRCFREHAEGATPQQRADLIDTTRAVTQSMSIVEPVAKVFQTFHKGAQVVGEFMTEVAKSRLSRRGVTFSDEPVSKEQVDKLKAKLKEVLPEPVIGFGRRLLAWNREIKETSALYGEETGASPELIHDAIFGVGDAALVGAASPAFHAGKRALSGLAKAVQPGGILTRPALSGFVRCEFGGGPLPGKPTWPLLKTPPGINAEASANCVELEANLYKALPSHSVFDDLYLSDVIEKNLNKILPHLRKGPDALKLIYEVTGRKPTYIERLKPTYIENFPAFGEWKQTYRIQTGGDSFIAMEGSTEEVVQAFIALTEAQKKEYLYLQVPQFVAASRELLIVSDLGESVTAWPKGTYFKTLSFNPEMVDPLINGMFRKYYHTGLSLGEVHSKDAFVVSPKEYEQFELQLLGDVESEWLLSSERTAQKALEQAEKISKNAKPLGGTVTWQLLHELVVHPETGKVGFHDFFPVGRSMTPSRNLCKEAATFPSLEYASMLRWMKADAERMGIPPKIALHLQEGYKLGYETTGPEGESFLRGRLTDLFLDEIK